MEWFFGSVFIVCLTTLGHHVIGEHFEMLKRKTIVPTRPDLMEASVEVVKKRISEIERLNNDLIKDMEEMKSRQSAVALKVGFKL